MSRLKDKVAIVTGGGSGFGAGIVRKFVAEGAQVLIADLNLEAALDVAASVGPAARALRVDVSNAADVRTDDGGRRAALRPPATSSSTTPASATCRSRSKTCPRTEFDRIFAVNMKAIYLALREVVPRFKAQQARRGAEHGQHGGVSPRPRLAWYNASKGWVITATRAMRGRTRALRHPRQRAQPGGRRNAAAEDLHGRGHAGDAREVPADDPARAASRRPKTWATPPASCAATRPG